MLEGAWAVSRCRNRWLAAKYWSLAARRGKKKALVAISHRNASNYLLHAYKQGAF